MEIRSMLFPGIPQDAVINWAETEKNPNDNDIDIDFLLSDYETDNGVCFETTFSPIIENDKSSWINFKQEAENDSASYSSFQPLDEECKITTLCEKRTFKCDFVDCTYEADKCETLSAHKRRIHSKNGPYACPHCNEEFKLKDSMKKHVGRKHNEKPHRCTSCDMRFCTKQELENHTFSRHSESKSFACTFCPGAKKLFKTPKALRRHIDHTHKERKHFCLACGGTFAYEYELNKHQAKFCTMAKSLVSTSAN